MKLVCLVTLLKEGAETVGRDQPVQKRCQTSSSPSSISPYLCECPRPVIGATDRGHLLSGEDDTLCTVFAQVQSVSAMRFIAALTIF